MVRAGLYWWDCRWKFWGVFIGDSRGYIDRIEVCCTEGNKLWTYGGIVLVTTLGTYYVTELVLSYLYYYGTAD